MDFITQRNDKNVIASWHNSHFIAKEPPFYELQKVIFIERCTRLYVDTNFLVQNIDKNQISLKQEMILFEWYWREMKYLLYYFTLENRTFWIRPEVKNKLEIEVFSLLPILILYP